MIKQGTKSFFNASSRYLDEFMRTLSMSYDTRASSVIITGFCSDFAMIVGMYAYQTSDHS